MKIKNLTLTAALLISIVSFAQKDELKALKKIYGKSTPSVSDLADYKSNLTKLESLATEEADKANLVFYKAAAAKVEKATLGPTPTDVQLQKVYNSTAISNLVTGYLATLEYEKKSGKKVFTDDIKADIAVVNQILVNYAISLGDKNKYSEATDILYSIYQLDKNDPEKLYYAATYAVNSKDYDKALTYYNELRAINYTGEGTMYYATNKETKKEDYFGTTNVQRDLMIKSGQYEKPRQEKIPSKKGEILKNVVLILNHQGKTEEAKGVISDARKANPEDTTLLLTEADFYLKEKDYTNYSRLVNEAIAKEPNNPDLLYNLGVISGESGKIDEAEKYYKKAIELDANYVNAYINLSELMLRADKVLADQMSKLGTSDSDNKKFDELRSKQIQNYKNVLPYVEKAYSLKPSDEITVKTLMGLYQALEMTDKVKELKGKK